MGSLLLETLADYFPKTTVHAYRRSTSFPQNRGGLQTFQQ